LHDTRCMGQSQPFSAVVEKDTVIPPSFVQGHNPRL
jgi:hypothetical protein